MTCMPLICDLILVNYKLDLSLVRNNKVWYGEYIEISSTQDGTLQLRLG